MATSYVDFWDDVFRKPIVSLIRRSPFIPSFSNAQITSFQWIKRAKALFIVLLPAQSLSISTMELLG